MSLVPVNTTDAAEDLIEFTSEQGQRFSTGWSVDETCGRVGIGELALVWARSSAGKSTWMLNVLANTPAVPTVIFNMEMTARRQLEWMTSMAYDLEVSARDMDTALGDASHKQHGEALSAVRDFPRLFPHLYFVSPSRPSVADLKASVDAIEAKTGVRPQRVFIDHLTLMDGATSYENVMRMGSALHVWAMEADLAVYCLQQTGRGGAGDGQSNDGHIPVSLSSGVFAGEHDADWIFGLFRPDRNPEFRKQRYQFKTSEAYEAMLDRKATSQGVTMMQVVKNRPYSDLCLDGIELRYNMHNRRLIEVL